MTKKLTKLVLITRNSSSDAINFLYEENFVGIEDIKYDIMLLLGVDVIADLGFKKEQLEIHEKLGTPIISEMSFKIDTIPPIVKDALPFSEDELKIYKMISEKEENGFLTFGIFKSSVLVKE